MDADSTLSGIEGVDWLAELRGPGVAEEVARLTEDAMAGLVPLEEVYARRLALIAPTAGEVQELAGAYLDHLAPGALDAVALLREAGVHLRVVSGGIRAALLPLARALGIRDRHVLAVEARFDGTGRYAGFVPSPLVTGTGKAEVVRSLALPRPTLAVGDGATDMAMRPEVDAFAAYVGFVRRDAVVADADLVVASFSEVAAVVLAGSAG